MHLSEPGDAQWLAIGEIPGVRVENRGVFDCRISRIWIGARVLKIIPRMVSSIHQTKVREIGYGKQAWRQDSDHQILGRWSGQIASQMVNQRIIRLPGPGLQALCRRGKRSLYYQIRRARSIVKKRT